jgi:hypothetical protein
MPIKLKIIKIPSEGEYSFYQTNNGLIISDRIFDNRRHISVSHKKRKPTTDEVLAIRYHLAENIKYMAEVYPPEDEYLKQHKTTRHLWEIVL